MCPSEGDESSIDTLIDELVTILDCGFGSPCIDESVFGPTASSFYWSASTGSSPVFAWLVDFNFGFVFFGSKDGVTHVRAVRSGSCP